MFNQESSHLRRHMLFSLLYEAGQTCWEAFRQSPIGKLKMRYAPSEKYRDKAEELFMTGFGHGCFRRKCSDVACIETAFESDWQLVLEASEGHVLLTGEPYPYTEPSVLEEAKRFYRFGYTYGLNESRESQERKAAQDGCRNYYSVTVARIG